MQADIFDAKIVKLSSEQGPGMGAAMLAAYGCEWFDSLKDCANAFLEKTREYNPIKENVDKYSELFTMYKKVYEQTAELNKGLLNFRD